MGKATAESNKMTIRVYWEHAKKYKKQLLTIYPTMVVAQVVEDFIQPVLISGIITNIAQGNTDELQLSVVWPILVVIAFTEIFGHLLWNRFIIPLFWRTQEMIQRDLAMTVFKHLQTMSYRFYSDRFAGSLVNQANKFVGSFERLTDALTWNVFKLIVAALATFVILMPRIPAVAIAILVIALIYIPLVWQFRKGQLPYNRKWATAESRRTGQLADTISNILAVKSFSNSTFEQKLMQDRVDDVFGSSMDTMRFTMNHELPIGFVQRSINVITIVISILLAINGNVEVGTIYLALTFTMTIMRKLWDLNNTFRQFNRVFGDASDMAMILAISPEVDDHKDTKDFKAVTGAIGFSGVTFWYPERTESESLFTDFNLNIKSGEKIGLVGPSGGGKTSITKLLLRFMDVQKGQILIDGHNISEISQDDLRRAISYVPQEPLLFHRSIRENIAYGKDSATENDIIEAAKKAHALEFINDLPDGMETLVGERGVKLSGGQKQRIAIARSMLKDAPIVVLDEATSALDSESEVAIQDALKELMKSKTAIVIAHRLSTIQNMDRIIVLDNGEIVEEGTHSQLLKNKKGTYAKLWSHQSGGFLQDD